ncbi:MAG: M56 family metallopeptidase [Nannocystaceae bacterium]|nr:M56 family metallopeptidase [Nannocystaceae bacterium]
MTAFVWILTYAVHSTVLIVFVWALLKLFPKVPLRLQESLWRVALFGGLATATVALMADVEPLGGRLALPATLQTKAAAAAPPSVALADAVVTRKITQHDAGDVRITTVQENKPTAVVAVASVPRKASSWPWVVVGLAGVGGLLALLRLGLGARQTEAKLRGRRDVIEDPILEKFFELVDAAGLKKEGKRRVRLTASPHLRSPVALMRREVVIPERAIERLTPAQQHGMVAHELAHLQRRDPQWALVTAVFEAAFVFQPLNHLARRKLQELAEFQCDDWAANSTGGGTHLAKCLAEVASWLDDSRTSALSVAMADRDSPVVRRITRLLHGRRRAGMGPVSPVLRVGCGTLMLGSAVWLAPSVAPAAQVDPPAATTAHRSGTPKSTVTVREVGGEFGERRSAVLIERDDERVAVHVDRIQAPPATPEPVGSGDRIVIRGFYGDSFPFGSGCGSVDVEVDLDGFEAEIEGAFGLGFPFSKGCDRRHEKRERKRGRLHRKRERLERKQERSERQHRRERHAVPHEVEAEPGVFHL